MSDTIRIIVKETKKLRHRNLPRGTLELLRDFLADAGIFGSFYLVFLRKIPGSSHLKGVNIKSFADDYIAVSLQPGGNDTCWLYHLIAQDEWRGRAKDLYHKLCQHQEFIGYKSKKSEGGEIMDHFKMSKILQDEDTLGLVLEVIDKLSGAERKFLSAQEITRELISKRIFSEKEFPLKALGRIPSYLADKEFLEKQIEARILYRLSERGRIVLEKQGFIKKETSDEPAVLARILEECARAVQEFNSRQIRIDKISQEIEQLQKNKDQLIKEQEQFVNKAERYKKIKEAATED